MRWLMSLGLLVATASAYAADCALDVAQMDRGERRAVLLCGPSTLSAGNLTGIGQMLNGISRLAAPLLLASFAVPAVASDCSLGATASTLGVGLEVGYALNEHFGLRLGGYVLTVGQNDEQSGINYNADLDLANVGLYVADTLSPAPSPPRKSASCAAKWNSAARRHSSGSAGSGAATTAG
ncbi:MAG: hypothetical protein ABI661_03895 [Gammaproteobacteria bacterium]